MLTIDGKLVNMWTGEPVDIAAIRAKVDAAHKKGLKVIGELIRMWDPEMLCAHHPEWQELKSPDAKPRGPEHKKEWSPVTGCWNSGYGDHYIRQCVELTKQLSWDGANLGGFGCWTQCYDLFGASFQSVENFTARWPNYPRTAAVTLAKHPICEDRVIRENYRPNLDKLDFIGMAAKVTAAPGAEVIAKRGDDPFLILSQHGKGKVAYFAADIGQSYFVAPYQYQRKLLANTLRWSAGNHVPEEVKAPMCVQTAFYTQEGGKRIIVHLLNEINTNANRALPESNSSMREEVVPIGGIQVLFHDKGIRRVHLEPEGQELTMSVATGSSTATRNWARQRWSRSRWPWNPIAAARR